MKNKFIYFCLFILISFLAFWFINKKEGTTVTNEANNLSSFYKNDEYKFSLPIFEDMKTSSFEEGGGTTVLIQNPNYQMQVYITPLDEDIEISIDKIKTDIPDLIMENSKEGKVDGVSSVTFVSGDLGEKYTEVWFVNGGYLYQTLSLAMQDETTNKIIKGWRWLK